MIGPKPAQLGFFGAAKLQGCATYITHARVRTVPAPAEMVKWTASAVVCISITVGGGVGPCSFAPNEEQKKEGTQPTNKRSSRAPGSVS